VIVWRLGPGLWFPGLRLRVLATDVDPEGLARARRGWYSRSSLKDLPPAYLEQAFAPIGQGWGLGEVYRDAVTFAEQDIRRTAPSGPFHLVLCRNVAFTYFDEDRQRDVLRTIVEPLVPGGALVVGRVACSGTRCRTVISNGSACSASPGDRSSVSRLTAPRSTSTMRRIPRELRCAIDA